MLSCSVSSSCCLESGEPNSPTAALNWEQSNQACHKQPSKEHRSSCTTAALKCCSDVPRLDGAMQAPRPQLQSTEEELPQKWANGEQ